MASNCNIPARPEIAYFVLHLQYILLIASDFLINSSSVTNAAMRKLR